MQFSNSVTVINIFYRLLTEQIKQQLSNVDNENRYYLLKSPSWIFFSAAIRETTVKNF